MLNRLGILLACVFYASTCNAQPYAPNKTDLTLNCDGATYLFYDDLTQPEITLDSPVHGQVTLSDDWLAALQTVNPEHQFLGFKNISCREDGTVVIGFAKFFEPEFDTAYQRSFMTGVNYRNEEIFHWGVDQSTDFKNRVKELNNLVKRH